MDVKQPPVVGLNELRLQKYHEARESDYAWLALLNGIEDSRLKVRETLKRGSFNDGRRNAGFLGDAKAARVTLVANDMANTVAGLVLDQGLKVGASPRNKYGN